MFKIRNLITCKEVFQQQKRFYAKEVRFGNEVKRLLLQGVDTIADAVSITLGPKGRNVIYEEKNQPIITKDGVTVARNIDLEDRWKNMGVKVIQSVAKNTNRRAGDGTTTATVLARTIAKEGFEKMIHGSNPNEIRKGMMMALDVALRNLDRISKPVVTHEDIKNVATISSNGDSSIGQLIAEALQKVGKEGNVTVKEGKTFKDSFEILNGIRIENGYVSPSFVNARGNKCILKDSLILFCDMKLTNVRPILHALDVAALKRKPVVIVAEDFEEEVIVAMILNKLRGGSKVAAVKSPGSGDYRREILYDMAAATGGRVYGDESLDEKSDVIDNSFFGRAEEIIITKDETLFLKCKGKKEAIDERADIIRGLIDQMNNDFDRKKYQERLARLLSGVAVINIGAGSDAELKEKKDRVEDAVHATRAAIEEGIVPGGGVALVRCIEEIKKVYTENDDQRAGVEVLANALKTPCMVIADNAGADSSLVFHKILEAKNDFGYDARNDVYVHMLQAGIIDPTKANFLEPSQDAISRVDELLTSKLFPRLLTTLRCVEAEEVPDRNSFFKFLKGQYGWLDIGRAESEREEDGILRASAFLVFCSLHHADSQLQQKMVHLPHWIQCCITEFLQGFVDLPETQITREFIFAQVAKIKGGKDEGCKIFGTPVTYSSSPSTGESAQLTSSSSTSKKVSKMKKLKNEIEILSTLKIELADELDTAKEAISQLESRLKSKDLEITKLKNTSTTVESCPKCDQEKSPSVSIQNNFKIEKLLSKIEKLEEEKTQLMEDRDLAEKQKNTTCEELKKAKSSIALFEKEQKVSQVMAADLETQITVLKEQMEQLQTVTKEQTEYIGELERRKEETGSEAGVLWESQEECSSLVPPTLQHEMIDLQMRDLEQVLESKEKSMQNLHKLLEEKDNEYCENVKRIESLKSEIKALKLREELLNEEFKFKENELLKEVASAKMEQELIARDKQELEKVNTTLKTEGEELKKSLSEKEAKLQIFMDQMNAYEMEIEKSRSDKVNLLTELEELKYVQLKNFNENKNCISNLEKEIESLNLLVIKYEEEMKSSKLLEARNEEELKAKMDKIKELEDSVNISSKEIFQMSKVIQRMNTEVETKNVTIKNNENDMRNLESQNLLLTSAIQERESTITSFNGSMKGLEEAIVTFKNRVNCLVLEIASKDGHISKLQEEIDSLVKVVNERGNEKRALLCSIEDKDKICEEYVKKLQESEANFDKEKRRFTEELESKNEENFTLKLLNKENVEKMVELNEEIGNIKEIVSGKDDQLVEKRNEIENLKKEVEELKSMEKSLYEKIDECEESIERYTFELATKEHAICILQDDIQMYGRKCEEHESEEFRLRQKIEEYEAKMSNLIGEMEDVKLGLIEEREKFAKELQSKTDMFDMLEASHEELMLKISQTTEDKSALSQEIYNKDNIIKNKDKRLKSLESEVMLIKEENEILVKELSSKGDVVSELKNRISLHESEIQTLLTEKQDQKHQIEKYISEVEEQFSRIENLQKEIFESKEKEDVLNEDIKFKTDLTLKLQGEIDLLKKEKNVQSEYLNSEIKYLSEDNLLKEKNIKDLISSCNEQDARANSYYSSMREYSEKIIALQSHEEKLSNMVNDYTTVNEELKKNLKEKENVIENLASKINSLDDSLKYQENVFIEKINCKDCEIRQLTEEINMQTDCLEKVNNKNTKLELKVGQLEEDLVNYKKSTESMELKILNLMKTEEILHKELDELEERERLMKEELNLCLTNCQNLQETKFHLEKIINDSLFDKEILSTKLQAKEAELNQLKLEVSEVNRRLKNTEDNYLSEMQIKNKSIEDLQLSLENLSVQIMKITSEKQLIESENEKRKDVENKLVSLEKEFVDFRKEKEIDENEISEKINQLKLEISAYEENMKELKNENVNLYEEMENKNEQISQHLKKNSDIEGQKNAYKDEIISLTEEKDILMKKMEKKDALLGEQIQKNEVSMSEIRSLENCIEILRKEKRHVLKELENTTGELAEIKRAKEVSEERIRWCDGEMESMKIEKERHLEEIELKRREISEYNQKEAELNDKILKCTNEIGKLKAENESMKFSFKEKMEEINGLVQQNKRFQGEMSVYKYEVELLKKEFDQKGKEVVELMQKKNEYEIQIHSYQNELENAKMENREKDEQIAGHIGTEGELNRQINAFLNDIQNLTNECEKKNEEIENERMIKNEYQYQLVVLKNNLATVEKENYEKMKEIMKYSQMINESENRIHSYENEIKILKNEKDKKNKEIVEYEKTKNLFEQQLQCCTNEIEILKTENEKKTEEVCEIAQKNSDFKIEIHSYKNEIVALKEANEALLVEINEYFYKKKTDESQIEAYKKEIDNLTQDIKRKSEDIFEFIQQKEEYDKNIDMYRNDIDNLKKTNEQLTNEIDEYFNKKKYDESQIELYKQEIENLVNENRRRAKEIDEFIKMKEDYDRTIDVHRSEIDILQKNNEEHIKEIDVFLQKQKDDEAQIKLYEKEIETLDIENKRRAEVVVEFIKEKDIYEKSIGFYKNDIDALKNEVMKKENEIIELLMLREKFENEIETLQSNIESLTSKREDYFEEMKRKGEEMAEGKTTIENLQLELQERQKKEEQLKEELITKTGVISSIEQNLKESERKTEDLVREINLVHEQVAIKDQLVEEYIKEINLLKIDQEILTKKEGVSVSQLQQKSNEYEEISMKLNEAKLEMEKLCEQVRKQEETMEALTVTIGQQNVEVSSKNQEISVLQKDMKSIIQNLAMERNSKVEEINKLKLENRTQTDKLLSEEDVALKIEMVKSNYEKKVGTLKTIMKKHFTEKLEDLTYTIQNENTELKEKLLKEQDRCARLQSELWNASDKLLISQERSRSLMANLQNRNTYEVPRPLEPLSPISKARSMEVLSGRNRGIDNFARDISFNESDASRRASIRSLPRGMGKVFPAAEEDGEVFDNRNLADLKAGIFNVPSDPDRMSVLQYRNSLCPPHLKSSYPAETQFISTLREDDIKTGASGANGESDVKKTKLQSTYKKPGPPTPSKSGGRPSLQGPEKVAMAHSSNQNVFTVPVTPQRPRDSDRFVLREVNMKKDIVQQTSQAPSRPKISTPKRIKALFSNKKDENSPTGRRKSFFSRRN